MAAFEVVAGGDRDCTVVPSVGAPVAIGMRWEETKSNVRRPRQQSFSDLKVARTNRTLPNCIVFEMFRYTCCIRFADIRTVECDGVVTLMSRSD
jgi:hypothetical protein